MTHRYESDLIVVVFVILEDLIDVFSQLVQVLFQSIPSNNYGHMIKPKILAWIFIFYECTLSFLVRSFARIYPIAFSLYLLWYILLLITLEKAFCLLMKPEY